ncbi:MAG: DUF192 domain-containing protein [Candidatus Nitrospinota bacterium M3_3B_026]
MKRASARALGALLAFALVHPQAAVAAAVSFTEADDPVTITVELATTPERWARGLMFRESLAPGSGMFFIFPREERRTFWMKNVRFPLDIIFLDSGYVIRNIFESAPPCAAEPCERYRSGSPARYVLETPGGFCASHGVREGQKVEFER